jgi:hypothetical protein
VTHHAKSLGGLGRRLARSTSIALAASAISAATASGQVEVVNEAVEHCPAVVLVANQVTGGCQVTVQSAGAIHWEWFGSLGAACDMIFGLALDEDGHGYAYDQSLTGSACTTPPCGSPQARTPWEVEMSEQSGATTMSLKLCVESAPLGTIRCDLAGIGVDTIDHTLAILTLDAVPCGGANSFIHLTGEFSAHGDSVEVEHL